MGVARLIPFDYKLSLQVGACGRRPPSGAGRRCEGAPAPAGRARPSPLHIKKALASKWYYVWKSLTLAHS
jgi:hypothetical protein